MQDFPGTLSAHVCLKDFSENDMKVLGELLDGRLWKLNREFTDGDRAGGEIVSETIRKIYKPYFWSLYSGPSSDAD